MAFELDQVLNTYRTKLKHVGSLWAQLAQHGQFDPSLMRAADKLMDQLETSALHIVEGQVGVERAHSNILNLKQVLDVTRQIVDAKSKHLRCEEMQIEEEQSNKLKEFQKIHKIEEEKLAIEKELVPAKDKLNTLMEQLSRKYNKKRYMEDFSDLLTEQLDTDIEGTKSQAHYVRQERSVWDKFDVDVLRELRRIDFDEDKLVELQTSVTDLKETLKNQSKWYEEELRTKLLYSSRNKEIQNKIAGLKTTIKRMERSGRYDDKDDSSTKAGRASPESEYSTAVMVDGVPDIQAKDVEDFLSQQFGIRVLADYTMLRRLKDEIGVVGLAYLVERIRFQDHFPASSSKTRANRTFKDLEEHQIETALETIAMEYRAQDETGLCNTFTNPGTDQSSPCTAHRMAGVSPAYRSPSTISHPADSGTSEPVVTLNTSGRQGSTSSLKSKSSLSRIKRIFKF